MKFYFANSMPKWVLKYKVHGYDALIHAPHQLYSYLYPPDPDFMALYPQIKIFIDSGAYTAYRQGTEVDIDAYIDYLFANLDKIELYACLDVIREAEPTYKNWLYMKKRGLNPLPVFHTYESYTWLEKYLDETDHIGLGGVAGVGMGAGEIKVHLDNCFNRIMKRWPVKVHAFGTGHRIDLLSEYPFHSADSTSWLSGSLYGHMSKADLISGKVRRDVSELAIYELREATHYITLIGGIGVYWYKTKS